VIFWLACGEPPRPAPVDVPGVTYALSVDVPFAELVVPPDSRGGRAPAARFAVRGPWSVAFDDAKGATFEAPLPVRPRAMFFFRPPEGMRLLDAKGKGIPHSHGAKQAWTFDAATLSVTRPAGSEPPSPGELSLEYPFATERERALNLQFSGKAPADFVRATIQAGPDSRAGLLLPAPATASFDVDVPAGGELSFAPGLVAPETADDAPSDGADARVEVEVGGAVTVVWRAALTDSTFSDVRVDLSRWAGQRVRLRFVTSPGETTRFDYAFFADPVLASRQTKPKRVVMVFVDTQRADHLGLYGYVRPTSPILDAFGKSAAVFENAHTVAPWTLPSTRSVYTGMQPESWASAETVQGLLRARGFRTAMFAGNVYLSANFDMNRGWGQHHVVNWPIAEDQVDLGLSWLRANEGHDSLLLLHFMDCHLPYTEPSGWRYRFAESSPPGLPESFERGAVVSSKLPPDMLRPYVEDRYDNNVAYLDHELGRLFAALSPDDVVVYFADHGEEFWDHGEFEHGHSTYEELMRVPLVVRAPGVNGTRSRLPASLLDVAPTVLDAVGLPAPAAMQGRSLLGVARGGDDPALASRDLAFGRPLYGPARWGVYHASEKYSTTEGRERVVDLGADPEEAIDRLSGREGDAASPYRARLSSALGREVRVGYRLAASPAAAGPKEDLVVDLVVPGGVSAAWVAEDPTDKSKAAVSVTADGVTARWFAHYRGGREVYVVPRSPLGEVTLALRMRVHRADGSVEEVVVPPDRPATLGRDREPLARSKVGGRSLTLGFGIAPDASSFATDATDPELSDALQMLGYAVGPEDAKTP
jgi:arylsulfatase A-like enzyme